ncbi:hypothetical protein DE167_004959 [Clostridium beijerinckii]|uniref:Uncharacterized protein n=1 Tax=Clostridium beijerinckii TaxID=1520 RepID=A0AAX0B2I1_CLOBE|nr:hypothetical protein [Clostridium beijerinckii]NYC74393.1 hypothetical protein [Clostridium beijerinckii]
MDVLVLNKITGHENEINEIKTALIMYKKYKII